MALILLGLGLMPSAFTIYPKNSSLVMVTDTYPIPLVDELIAKLNGSRYFSRMDLTEGYWNIMLRENTKKLTGYQVNGKVYLWNRMVMEMKNSGLIFQK